MEDPRIVLYMYNNVHVLLCTPTTCNTIYTYYCGLKFKVGNNILSEHVVTIHKILIFMANYWYYTDVKFFKP